MNIKNIEFKLKYVENDIYRIASYNTPDFP